ncbi:MAG: hypothetical protein QM680_01635 [Luteolibacter sp.]
MDFLNGFFLFVLVPAAAYLTLVALFYMIVMLFFRVRYRSPEGAQVFLHRYTRPHWVAFRRNRAQGVQAIEKTHGTSVLCVVLGCVGIWQTLRSFEMMKPDWFFMLVATAMPFFHGFSTATTRFAASCFQVVGIDYMPEYPKGE